MHYIELQAICSARSVIVRAPFLATESSNSERHLNNDLRAAVPCPPRTTDRGRDNQPLCSADHARSREYKSDADVDSHHLSFPSSPAHLSHDLPLPPRDALTLAPSHPHRRTLPRRSGWGEIVSDCRGCFGLCRHDRRPTRGREGVGIGAALLYITERLSTRLPSTTRSLSASSSSSSSSSFPGLLVPSTPSHRQHSTLYFLQSQPSLQTNLHSTPTMPPLATATPASTPTLKRQPRLTTFPEYRSTESYTRPLRIPPLPPNIVSLLPPPLRRN